MRKDGGRVGRRFVRELPEACGTEYKDNLGRGWGRGGRTRDCAGEGVGAAEEIR